MPLEMRACRARPITHPIPEENCVRGMSGKSLGETTYQMSAYKIVTSLYLFAPIQGASPMVVPWAYFLDAKNHKTPTFSRKIMGLRFFNLAVKERFEPTSIQASAASDSPPKQ